MLKLFKQLKPYTWLIVIIFGLLFGQAMADLTLPSYMANIVNIGIQQGGIENAGNLKWYAGDRDIAANHP